MDSSGLYKSTQTLSRAGRVAEAETLCRQAIAASPDAFEPHYLLGLMRLHQQRDGEAADLFRAALRIKPDSVEALSNCARALQHSGHLQEALTLYDRALGILPDDPQNLNHRANILQILGRTDEALDGFDRVLAMRPNAAGTLYYRALALFTLGRLKDALADYDRALAIKPDFVAAMCSRGDTLRLLGQPEESLAAYERALVLEPGYPDAFFYRGQSLMDLWRYEEALTSYDKAIATRPDFAEAFLCRGIALARLHRPGEAVASYDRALALKPDFVDAYFRRGVALEEQGYLEEAIANYDRVITYQPNHVAAINNRSVVLQKLRRFAEAAKGYERILAIAPANRHALGGLATAAMHACDWLRRDEFLERMRAEILADRVEIQPGTLLGYSGDPALGLACARNYLAEKLPPKSAPLWRGKPFSGDKIRLAYCSANFHSHPMPRLLAGMFEAHDRARFEVIAISFGPDDGSEMRKRLLAAFDRFHDVQPRSERAIAALIADLGIDIAIDLMGLTAQLRTGIFALRPAPVQVNYMGFPGTMGADFIDYIIADKVVLPTQQQPHYAEKIVQLPDSYLVNDDKREPAPAAPTRAEAGLPEQGFVFCCFNNNWKINPPLFDVWLRLLNAVPGSVLWLLEDSREAIDNLRRHATERGVAPERLMFAPRIAPAQHLARHGLADLFLDTLPYNAHTTASDSLWVGVPLVTCLGEGFHGRVAASALHAIGLAELVTENLADYEALALALARDPSRLSAIRRRLGVSRATAPLFDTKGFTRGLEAAFSAMADNWRGTQSP